VIIGAHTPIGSSIIRLLTSINLENIVAVSPEGTIPDGVDPKKVIAFFGDVLDHYTLLEVISEGDIIYNCQIVSEESFSLEEARLYNQNGITNVLGVSSEKNARKVVMAFPQSLGYKIPHDAKENDWGEKPSPIQQTLRSGLEIIKNYWEESPFGWDRNLISQSEDETQDENESNQVETSGSSMSSGPKIKSGPSTDSGPSIPSIPSNPAFPPIDSSSSPGPSLGPKISSGPSLGSVSGPTLGKEKKDDESFKEKFSCGVGV
jgi:hypothetical protein